MKDDESKSTLSRIKNIKDIFYKAIANRFLEPSIPKWVYCVLLIIENIQIINYSLFIGASSLSNTFLC